MPAALLAVTALLVLGGTAAPARADSDITPEAIADQVVDAAQGIAAETLAGDEAADGLAAPTGGTLGTPSPAPSGQVGAAPANGQAGAAPSEMESSEASPEPPHPPPPPDSGAVQQDASASPDTGAPASSGDAGTAPPAPQAPAGAGAPGTTPISVPSEPPLVADEPPTRIYEPGSEPPPMRRVRTQPHPAPRPVPPPQSTPAAPFRPAAAVPATARPYATTVAGERKRPARARLQPPTAHAPKRSLAPPARRHGVAQHGAAAATSAGGSTASPTVAALPGVAALAAQGPLSRLLASVPSWRLLTVAEPPERPG